jgi:hypothetical protein
MPTFFSHSLQAPQGRSGLISCQIIERNHIRIRNKVTGCLGTHTSVT